VHQARLARKVFERRRERRTSGLDRIWVSECTWCVGECSRRNLLLACKSDLLPCRCGSLGISAARAGREKCEMRRAKTRTHHCLLDEKRVHGLLGEAGRRDDEDLELVEVEVPHSRVVDLVQELAARLRGG